jgi:CRP/FNR family transcriptional regulator, cyclic AMP receptor protein
MTPAETLGYLACGLVLLTFGMRTMMAMRVAAIGSNLAFVAYGLALDLPPIWALHTALLPLNAFRLLELQRGAKRRRGRRSSRRISPSARLGLGLDPR